MAEASDLGRQPSGDVSFLCRLVALFGSAIAAATGCHYDAALPAVECLETLALQATPCLGLDHAGVAVGTAWREVDAVEGSEKLERQAVGVLDLDDLPVAAAKKALTWRCSSGTSGWSGSWSTC